MKKNLIKALTVLFMLPGLLHAGGLVTNTNQSASFVRNPAQNAVIGAEGTYFNPAGLVRLPDGLHFSLSNQIITQTREISSTFPNMNQSLFEGSVSAPIFPSFYGVFKQGRLAYSLGINPIGGGGSAIFDDGLPSFEQQVAVLPVALSAAGIPTSQYSLLSSFDGRSLNWGIQANTSYAINDVISVSLGLRVVIANNAYKGYLREIMINPNQPGFGAQFNGVNMVSANQFFTIGAQTLNTLAGGAATFSGNLTPYVGTHGAVPIENVVTDPVQLAQLRSIITAAGQNPTGMDVATAVTVLDQAQPVFTAQAATMSANAVQTEDRRLDAEQSGWGIAPIIGAHFRFGENLDLSLKYEHRASITMTNETAVDDVGLYPDGVESRNDMPAMLALGVAYKPFARLTVSVGGHYYFDKSADFGRKIEGEFVPNDRVIDNNFWEAAVGMDYMLSDRVMLSAGFLRTQTGVNEYYQSDLTHSLSTNTVAFGGRYQLNNNLAFNLGIMNIFYEEYMKDFSAYTETYDRTALSIGLGVDIRL